VRTMNVIVLDVLTQDQPQVPLAGYQHAVQVIPTSGRSRTSHQIPAMTRSVSVAVGCLLVSAIAFLLGCSNMAVPLPPTVTVPCGCRKLCHQAIFVNHASGAVAAKDAEVVQVGDAIR
jgi:hypothetical protein